jgi:hypothetical protein
LSHSPSRWKYESDIQYEFLLEKANESWDWGSAAQGYLNVAAFFRKALPA